MKIFLSYSREDVATARRVVDGLSQKGVDAWWDERIGVGEAFRQRIDAKLSECDFVVVLWTDRSIHSKWVLSEALAARDVGKLLSVALGGAIPPLGFRQFQFLQVSEADDTELERLATLISGLETARPHQVLRERRGFLSIDFGKRYRLGVWKIAAWALVVTLAFALIAAPFLETKGTWSAYMLVGAFLSLWLGRLVLPDPEGVGRSKPERWFELHVIFPFALAIAIVAVWLMYIAWARSGLTSIEELAAPNYTRMAMLSPLTACAIYIVPSVFIRILHGLWMFRLHERVKRVRD